MHQRDQDLAVSRGLGKGLVTAGILGSLGFAVAAAVSSTTAPTGASGSTPHVRGAARPHVIRGATTGQDGTEEQGADDRPVRPVRPHRSRPSRVAPAPGLGLGSGGAPQATTAGS